MRRKSPERIRLEHILEAIENIRTLTEGKDLETFSQEMPNLLASERCIEIISEASRHLTTELKLRHPDVPWRNIADIGNVLRHDYERVSPQVILRTAQHSLGQIEAVCREEIEKKQAKALDQKPPQPPPRSWENLTAPLAVKPDTPGDDTTKKRGR